MLLSQQKANTKMTVSIVSGCIRMAGTNGELIFSHEEVSLFDMKMCLTYPMTPAKISWLHINTGHIPMF